VQLIAAFVHLLGVLVWALMPRPQGARTLAVARG